MFYYSGKVMVLDSFVVYYILNLRVKLLKFQHMKPFRIIPVLLFLLLISCDKNEQNQENTNHLLLGIQSPYTNSDSTNYLIEKQQYCLSYNNIKHIANWVSWHLQKTDLGSAERSNNFKSDTTLPKNWYLVKYSDYTNTGFDRGHLCPSADRTNSATNNSATFLMTNIVPQSPKLNSTTWQELESYCRNLLNEGSELYIIAGCFGQGGTGSLGFANTIKNNISVPAIIWKIIVVLPLGTNDLNRIDINTRIIAVSIPNSQESSNKTWYEFRVSVNTIESFTGLNFLSNIPEPIQDKLELKTDTL
jgi:endonuclease G